LERPKGEKSERKERREREGEREERERREREEREKRERVSPRESQVLKKDEGEEAHQRAVLLLDLQILSVRSDYQNF